MQKCRKNNYLYTKIKCEEKSPYTKKKKKLKKVMTYVNFSSTDLTSKHFAGAHHEFRKQFVSPEMTGLGYEQMQRI